MHQEDIYVGLVQCRHTMNKRSELTVQLQFSLWWMDSRFTNGRLTRLCYRRGCNDYCYLPVAAAVSAFDYSGLPEDGSVIKFSVCKLKPVKLFETLGQYFR